jgi:hypothetical protein
LVKKNGSLFIAQLSHPGRQGGAALNPNPVSASDVQLKIEWAGNKFNQPRALTVPEIKDLVKHWGEVAYLCYQAGFDGVQIHCGKEGTIDETRRYPTKRFSSTRLSLSTIPVSNDQQADRRVRRRPRQPQPHHLRDHRGSSPARSGSQFHRLR